MKVVRDCFGSVVCMVDGMSGYVERRTTREIIRTILPVGGKIEFDARGASTVLERLDELNFYVNSWPDR